MSDDKFDVDEYFVPLVDQRVFGAGLKRKRVAFVPASSHNSTVKTNATPTAGNRYLSIVLQKEPGSKADVVDEPSSTESKPKSKTRETPVVCDVCGQSLLEADSHATSIAHQICIKHSHPPSHLDRSHVGLRYLQDHGWDPDSRRGLGARQEGIRAPIKAKEKHDSAGLGLYATSEDTDIHVRQKKKKIKEEPIVKLNAREVRRIEEEKSRRVEKLRQSLYGPDLSQYLGSNG